MSDDTEQEIPDDVLSELVGEVDRGIITSAYGPESAQSEIEEMVGKPPPEADGDEEE